MKKSTVVIAAAAAMAAGATAATIKRAFAFWRATGLRTKLSIIAVLALAFAGLTAGVSEASIPAPNGVIHASS